MPYFISMSMARKRRGQCCCVSLLFIIAMTSTPVGRSQDQPPSSPEAKRIEALVNKAATIVDTKGKAALSEFRERGIR